jgi:hypothetical protein
MLVSGADLPFRERFHLPSEEPDRRVDTPAAVLASARASGGRTAPRRAVVRSGRPLCPAAVRRSFGVQVSILGDTRSRRQPGPGVEMITLRSTAPGGGGAPACPRQARRGQRVITGPGREPGTRRIDRVLPPPPAVRPIGGGRRGGSPPAYNRTTGPRGADGARQGRFGPDARLDNSCSRRRQRPTTPVGAGRRSAATTGRRPSCANPGGRCTRSPGCDPYSAGIRAIGRPGVPRGAGTAPADGPPARSAGRGASAHCGRRSTPRRPLHPAKCDPA